MKNLLEQIYDLREEIVKKKPTEKEQEHIDNFGLDYQKNANEVENTTNTGYGEELVPRDVLSTMVYDAVPTFSNFLDKLPGYHGENMAISEKVPVIGEIGYGLGNPEWTTGQGIIEQGNNRLPTGEVQIDQAPIIISVDISKRLLNHSITKVEDWVINGLGKSAAKTFESMIINGDTSDLSTGNVNCDDAIPSSTLAGGANNHKLLLNNGLRKLYLDGTANIDYKDVGTLEFDDFIEVRSLLGDYSTELDELLLLMNTRTYNKTLIIDEFKEQYQNGITSTITDGELQDKLAGVEYVKTREIGLTEADGKQSGATPANNTKGGFIYLRKSAVQWGYGQPVELDVVKIPGKGISVIGTMEVGFGIVNKKADVTDPSVVGGINATV